MSSQTMKTKAPILLAKEIAYLAFIFLSSSDSPAVTSFSSTPLDSMVAISSIQNLPLERFVLSSNFLIGEALSPTL